MKHPRILLDYALSLFKDFHRLFHEVLETYGRETIHDLRVNMKKQVAFFRFLEAVDPSFSVKEARQAYGELYDLAGKIRDLQVERMLLRQRVRLGPFFVSWLRQREDEYLELLQNYELELTLIPIRAMERSVEQHILALQAEPMLHRFEAYLSDLLQKIRDVLQDEEMANRLHYLRKRLKELYFNLRMMELLNEEVRFSKQSIKTLDKYQTLLGKWHDLDFIRLLLREEPGVCSAKTRRRVDKDFEKATQKTLDELGSLLPKMKPLEKQISKCMKIALKHAKSPPPSLKISFPQRNVEEGIK